ncbi:hypothetical protein ACQZ4Y_03970 [Rhizobium sp. L80/93]|uniref:hypothetical protein n=1 Tax=Rhizobium sp. E27B/91 TaxID=2819995 RepID=UPI001ADAD357|nr:hypothetical protein [Rhizobium sp. E27B/91]MBO9184576.1 hypothetical protein [Rhizobium sp. E27B/91]
MGKTDLQLTYISTAIRQVTLDRDVARQLLGPQRAGIYQGLIADLREADFLGEVPGEWHVQDTDKGLLVSFDIGDRTALVVEPLDKDWQSAHRVLLRKINRDQEDVV